MRATQTKLAAGLSLVALGGFAGYAVGAGSGDPPAAPAAARQQPLEVRTQTIRRTVRIVKHEKPRPKRQPRPVEAPTSVAQAQQPVVAALSAPPRVRAPATVRTRTSGGAGRGDDEGHEREHEGDGHDD